MKIIKKILVLILLVSIFQLETFAQGLTPDGPYIIKTDNCYQYISIDKKGNIINKTLNNKPKRIKVLSDNSKHSFDVRLMENNPQRTNARIDEPDKIVVVSDPHGDFESLYQTLVNNKVIDKKHNWIFGNNQLMVIGDVFDRGDDCTTILWLLYKLEQEASMVGGVVHLLIGNHEDMVLKGDDRYVNNKYITLADTLKIEHKALYATNTIFGEWLRTKNLIQIIGDNLFVHGGLSTDFAKTKLNIDNINATVTHWLGTDRETLAAKGGDTEMLYRTHGPLWYRGMVYDDKKYNPISVESTKKILEAYDVKKIIVGHSIFEDISLKQDGNVVTVNVRPEKNRLANKGMGIMIEGNEFSVIYADKPSIKMQ